MKTALIYLAAGNSKRFGSNKLLCEIEGKPMYRHLLERLLALCERCPELSLFCVTQYEEIAEFSKNIGITAVISPDSTKGASFSVKAGLTAVKASIPDTMRYVFFVADQPYLLENTVEAFLDAAENSAKGISCVCHNGETGNPVSFSVKYFDELMGLEGDKGGKSILKKHTEDLFLFEVSDENELRDIDYFKQRI